jgi:glucokinase
MLMLTLGTGLGSGIVLDGGLWRGDHGAGAEAGHMILVPDGRECPCGQRGCFERYVSATAVVDRYRERAAMHPESAWLKKFRAAYNMPDAPIASLPLTSAHVSMARNEDALAADVWDETCKYLAIGCLSLMRLLDVRRIVLGGGLAEAGDALLEPTLRHYAHGNWHVTRDRPEIVCAAAGIDAGVIGNAALARKMASV